MARRIAALALWAYFGWYLTAFLFNAVGLPASIAPIGGLAAAAIAMIDRQVVMRSSPLHRRESRGVSLSE